MDMIDPDIEAYAIAHTSAPDAGVAALRAETEATTPAPQMAGGLVEAKLLEALVVATRATLVLEIGMFTGVSALSMASRLQPGSKLITLELNEETAAIARRHISASPYADRIDLRMGDAMETIKTLSGPFDLVFIDAWKPDYIDYYEAVLPLLADHGIIVADNVLRAGDVLADAPADPSAAALREFGRHVRDDPRVDTAFLTVADGLLLIWKRDGNGS
jgi:caffeoyl-CoA O-methyltransferase